MTKPANYPTTHNALWESFYEVSLIPRPSKKEDKFIAFLEKYCSDRKLAYKKDKAGNVVIYLPATKGFEKYPTLLLQGHMDMVCEKTPERQIDFDNDPIRLKVVNGWVMGDNTTLGADNGIACAFMLALTKEEVPHPNLELLFTTDEETGLHGAKNLDTSMISATRMINLDTEEWGAIYIGCAGGIDYNMRAHYLVADLTSDVTFLKLHLGNLAGGHSGLDIHKGRANAIRLLAEILIEAHSKSPLHLVSFDGGKAHNVIPRDAHATIAVSKTALTSFKDLAAKKIEIYRSYLLKEDQTVTLEITESPAQPAFVETEKFLNFFALYPHGAVSYNWQSEEPLVTYSSNLAIVRTTGAEVYSQTSLRFTDPSEAENLKQRIRSLAKTFSFSLEEGVGYPSWKPIFDNPFLDQVKSLYQERYHVAPKVKAIHAGLECGILKEKLKKIDIISIGPNIKGAHSPTESLEIDSTNKLWDFFVEILKIK